MAVYRETPTCNHCGEPVAKANHNVMGHGFIGDTFSHWDHWICECEGAVAERKKIQEQMKPLADKLRISLEKSKRDAEKKRKKIAKQLKKKAEKRKKIEESIKSKLTEEELKFLKLD